MALLCAIAVASAAGPAHAGKRKRRHSNMPDGWSWPPTAEMMRTGRECLARLDQLGVRWRKAPKARKVVTPVVVPSMELGGIELVSVYRQGPHVMDCHLAAALAEQGPALYELGVRQIRFTSIHRYTRVRTGGKQLRALSRHALGMAIDIRDIVDDAGVAHNIAEDYLNDDQLLLAVEGVVNESGDFRLALTPANDPASHDDHFHFEARVDYAKKAKTRVEARSSRAKPQRATHRAQRATHRAQRTTRR